MTPGWLSADTAAALLSRDDILWHQRFELSPGVFTPGVSDVEKLLALAGLPDDLSGASALDIGTTNGGTAFALERRGATRVLATDIYDGQRFGFNAIRDALGSHVEFRTLSVYELSRQLVEKFDFVIFWGVLYHLRHPLLALDNVRAVTAGRAYIETAVCDYETLACTDVPIARFYRFGELAGDSSNWFAPNIAALMDWCRSSGLEPDLIDAWPQAGPGRALVAATATTGVAEYETISYERPMLCSVELGPLRSSSDPIGPGFSRCRGVRYVRDRSMMSVGNQSIEGLSDVMQELVTSPSEELMLLWRSRIELHNHDSYAGVPMSKFPEDLRTYEHLLWDQAPQAVIEVGVRDGGSILWFRDRLFELQRYRAGRAPLVVGVDVDLSDARASFAELPPEGVVGIELIEGDIKDDRVVGRIHSLVPREASVLVVEDAQHDAATTLAALRALAPLVRPGGYYMVEDTCVDVESLRVRADWPRGCGVALNEWLETDALGRRFRRRPDLQRYGLTCHPGGLVQRQAGP